MLNFYRVARSFGRFQVSSCKLWPHPASNFFSGTFWVVLCFSPVSFQFRNAAVNVAEAGSDVRLRGAQMEEVCNSRVKEINFSMRALFSAWNQDKFLSQLERRQRLKTQHQIGPWGTFKDIE